jgi:hypothetical protein
VQVLTVVRGHGLAEHLRTTPTMLRACPSARTRVGADGTPARGGGGDVVERTPRRAACTKAKGGAAHGSYMHEPLPVRQMDKHLCHLLHLLVSEHQHAAAVWFTTASAGQPRTTARRDSSGYSGSSGLVTIQSAVGGWRELALSTPLRNSGHFGTFGESCNCDTERHTPTLGINLSSIQQQQQQQPLRSEGSTKPPSRRREGVNESCKFPTEAYLTQVVRTKTGGWQRG